MPTMSFREFLLAEANVQVTTNPGLESYIGKAQEALKTYFNRYGGPELKFASVRYNFHLKEIDKGWYEYDRYVFTYQPIEKNRSTPEIADKDDYRYEVKPDWDGKTGKRLYKTPKDALESIPADPSLGYRGISWEEWQSIRKTGIIRSHGGYNLQGQDNLTFWSPRPDTAEYYANGFAPIPFKASTTRPGVVIAVPRSLLKDHKQHPGIPQGELAHLNDLPISKITDVWMLTVTKSKPGFFDLHVFRDGKVKEGSRSDISINYAIRKLK
jgi:hypothetical protein